MVSTHPMKLGRIVHDRAWVLMAMLFSRACFRLGNATKNGPVTHIVTQHIVHTQSEQKRTLPRRPSALHNRRRPHRRKARYGRLFLAVSGALRGGVTMRHRQRHTMRSPLAAQSWGLPGAQVTALGPFTRPCFAARRRPARRARILLHVLPTPTSPTAHILLTVMPIVHDLQVLHSMHFARQPQAAGPTTTSSSGTTASTQNAGGTPPMSMTMPGAPSAASSASSTSDAPFFPSPTATNTSGEHDDSSLRSTKVRSMLVEPYVAV